MFTQATKSALKKRSHYISSMGQDSDDQLLSISGSSKQSVSLKQIRGIKAKYLTETNSSDTTSLFSKVSVEKRFLSEDEVA